MRGEAVEMSAPLKGSQQRKKYSRGMTSLRPTSYSVSGSRTGERRAGPGCRGPHVDFTVLHLEWPCQAQS